MKTYQLVWRMIRYRPWLYLIDMVMWACIHISPVIPGLIAQQFFNTLSVQKHLSGDLWLLIVLLLATALGRVVLVFGGAMADIPHRFIMSALLRHNLLQRILERPGARAVPDSPGEAISRFRDDAEHVEDFISWTLDSIGTTLFALVSFILLLRINVIITLLVFVPLIAVVAVVRSARTRLEKYRAASSQATSKVTSAIGEIFATVQAIQIAGVEKPVVEHFQTLNEQRRILMLRDRLMKELLDSTFENTVGLGTGFILLFAAQLLHQGQLGVGDLALFIYYLAFVSNFTHDLGTILAQYTQAKVAFQRMVKLLQGAPPQKLVEHNPLYLRGPVPAMQQISKGSKHRLERLEAFNLTYHYPETGRGIEGIDIELKRGSITVITGRIASGKTTLLRTLLGLLPKDEGEIRWNGERVPDPASFFVPPRSAYTAQVPQLFSGTLQENILLNLSEERVDINRAISTAVMEHDIAELEHGLQTLIGSKGVKLSGGQAQRAAAARMLVRDPELLVFDDLSSALDVNTEQLLWERLFAQEKRTCLVVSHRRTVLQRADRIIVLKEGKVEAVGTLEGLLNTCEEMQRLWNSEIAESGTPSSL